MGIGDLIRYDNSYNHSRMGGVDPRVKLSYVFLFSALIIYFDTVETLLIIFAFTSLVAIISFGVTSYFTTYYTLKIYTTGLVFFLLMFSGRDLELMAIVLLKLFTIMFCFQAFSLTTTPLELTSSLISLKFPKNLAWSIGLTLQQSMILIHDLEHIQEIQRNRLATDNLSLSMKSKQRVQEVFRMLTTIISRSIVISKNLAITLKSRGFKGAHQEISLAEQKITFPDLLFLFTFSLVGILSLIISH